MLRKLSILFISATLLVTTGCVTRESVKVSSHHNVGPNTKVSLYFSTADRARIKHYYTYNHRHPLGGPPGQMKRHPHKFKRHQTLPRNYSYSRLPHDLERNLPALPRDYIRIRIGEDFAILNTRTRVIYDVMWFLE